jgi:hypothetical protein
MPKHRLLCLKGEKPGQATGRPPLCVVELPDDNADDKFALARQQSLGEFFARGVTHPGFDTYLQDIADDAAPLVQPTLTLEGAQPAKKSKEA